MAKVEFVGKPTKMGKKIIIIVPNDFHDQFNAKIMGKFMKFQGETIIEK